MVTIIPPTLQSIVYTIINDDPLVYAIISTTYRPRGLGRINGLGVQLTVFTKRIA